MGVHSGKYGAIDGQSSIIDWTVNDNMTPAEYVVSGSGIGRVRVEGIKNWDGSYNQLTSEPSLLPGETGAFKGYTAPDDDVYGNAGVTYNGDILVSQVQINWDWGASEAINSNITFLGDGELTTASEAVTDDTIPNPEPICPAKIESSPDGTTWTEIPNIESAQLTLLVDTIDYMNSSTNCETGRKSGPVDWNLSLTQQDNIRAGHIDIGNHLYFRCWVDASTYWFLQWGLVQDFTGLSVNISTGDIISRTINIVMSATDGTTLGGVVAPSGKVWWGSAPVVAAAAIPPTE